MSTTRDTVTQRVAEATGRDPNEIDDTSRLAEDLRLKSANRIELVVLIGDELGVEVSMLDALKAKTLGDLIALVDARRADQTV